MSEQKRKAKHGDKGQALYISWGATWWHVTDENADRETGHKQANHGCYGPFDQILANSFRVFPDYELEQGAIVRVTVEVVRP